MIHHGHLVGICKQTVLRLAIAAAAFNHLPAPEPSPQRPRQRPAPNAEQQTALRLEQGF